MFNKKFKLMATAVGLVAVLAGLMAMPGATQQPPSPWIPPFRPKIPEVFNQVISGTLTASEGDIFDTDATVFVSHPRMTSAYIPLHPSSRSWRNLVKRVLTGEKFGVISLGAYYIEGGIPGLKAGLYTLKIDDDSQLIAIDPSGNDIVIGSARCLCERKIIDKDKPHKDEVRVRQFAVHDEGNPLWKIIVVGIIIYKVLTDDDGNSCSCQCTAGGGG